MKRPINVFPGKQAGKASYFSIKHLLAGIIGVCTLVYVSICCIFIANSVMKPSDGMNSPPSGMFVSVIRSLRGVKPLSQEEQDVIDHMRIRATLGRGTWNLLHRLAAQFDKSPSDERKATIETFFKTFSDLYPCEECAAHFRQLLSDSPVDSTSNRHLSLWLCEVHNKVNERLKKPLFSCTIENLQKEYGSCGCFSNETSSD